MAGFVLRWAFAALLLAATYNPTPYNYVRWGLDSWEQALPLTVLGGLILSIGYIIYLRASLRSIGVFGLLLVLAIIGTALWVLYDYLIISLRDPSLNTWLAIAVFSFVLAIGLSWSIVRRRLSGQADVDDIDE